MNKNQTIRHFTFSGSTEHDWVLPINHEKIWKDMLQKGINLPEYYTIERPNLNVKELMVMTNTEGFTARFDFYNRETKNWELIKIKVNCGFIWDGASVPNVFRSFIDNDAYEVKIAAILHDALFATHALGFDTANDIFESVMMYFGVSPIRRKAYMFGLNTSKSKKVYNSIDPEDHWSAPYVEIYVDDHCVFNKGAIDG